MIQANRKHTIGALLGLGVAALLIWGVDNEQKPQYHHDAGDVFGTYYNIRYEAKSSLCDSIQAALTAFDNSLSMFNPYSILSAVNANRDTTTDAAFEAMWAEATQVYDLSNGAFDITVGPLVNYWGFGSKNRNIDISKSRDIDSITEFVGFEKVRLENHKVIKYDARVQLDAGAVAKGQACDMIAAVLQRQGCENYLVDIGGEVVAHGLNDKGEPWHVGITKPNLNNEGAQEQLQEILAVTDVKMATSGNYRTYYYADGEQSHYRSAHRVSGTTLGIECHSRSFELYASRCFSDRLYGARPRRSDGDDSACRRCRLLLDSSTK